MKVLVITGGNSNEREISLLSSQNVIEALKNNGHLTEVIDFNKGSSEILNSAKHNDIVFPVLHGIEGESGILQKVLEDSKIKFVGSSSKASKLGWNKIKFKNLCTKLSIKTAPWFILNNTNIKQLNERCDPFVIKPIESGSSVDIYICKTLKDLKNINLVKLLKKYESLLIEDYIEGVEITVGILNNQSLPIIEIIPPIGEWFSYENKYNGASKEIPNAPSLSMIQQKNAQNIALKIHKQLKCRHYSRSDFILSNNEFYALEINTIPGLTKQSLLPKAALAAGISFNKMVDILVTEALKS